MLKKIKKQITEKRAQMDKAIEQEKSYSEIYRLSVELDHLIMQYYTILDNEETQKEEINSKDFICKSKNDESYKSGELIKISYSTRIKNFFKNRKKHPQFYRLVINKILMLLFGVIILPNIINDVMQRCLSNNVILWNLGFFVSSVMITVNLLFVTVKFKDWKHIIGISVISVAINSIRYFCLMRFWQAVFSFLIPMIIANICMIYIYQFVFFRFKRGLTTAGVCASIVQIGILFLYASLLETFFNNDVYAIILINNVLVYHQVIANIIAIFVLSCIYSIYVKKADIKIEKYHINFSDIIIKENQDKNKKTKVRTLVDY